MWTIASTTDVLGTLYSDAGTVLAYVLPVIIATALAIVGLGFGWRHLKKYILGRKF